MKKRGKTVEWIKNPHGPFLALFYIFAIASAAGAVFFCTRGELEMPLAALAYTLYAVAAVTFSYSVYTIVRFIPELKKRIVSWAGKYEFTDKMMKNYGFRTIIFSIASVAISIIYALFNGVVAIISMSVWYGALAAYYLLLVFLRGGAVFYHKKKKRFAAAESESEIKVREIRTYRTCGALLVVLAVALSSAVAQMVLSEKAFEHAGLTIYASALYTCYKVVKSVANLVKAKRQEDMTVQAIRNINLADAFVSILALQTAMLRAFAPDFDGSFANGLTGAIVCFATAALGVFMIVNANAKLKKTRMENYNG